MRTLSPEFIGAVYDPETDEAVVVLLTITHASLDAPIRVSNHNTVRISDDPVRYATLSRGQTYEFLPFSLSLPEEGDDVEPAMQITIENVSRELTPLISSITTPPGVLVELVTASHPDVVEVPFPDFEMTSAEIDAGSAVLSLSLDALTQEPFPGYDFTPSNAGGLWSTV
ncbi:hypothetical protein GCM10011390_41600 [Aureimonas endophytica]|uniref:DUF1833 domain-containing protein n=1 Tax=Aureimonas endophytica TaxID=2027858 RepID=A0A916ZYR3_9HYPH|nr:DUF1833 family protein [Aureimonas endophytica]GGE18096.1 hypothetical protein GCM10011390_41600 [Aureimonas endophytica]